MHCRTLRIGYAIGSSTTSHSIPCLHRSWQVRQLEISSTLYDSLLEILGSAPALQGRNNWWVLQQNILAPYLSSHSYGSVHRILQIEILLLPNLSTLPINPLTDCVLESVYILSVVHISWNKEPVS